MTNTKTAIETALKAIGEVLATLVEAVDASAREHVRTQLAAIVGGGLAKDGANSVQSKAQPTSKGAFTTKTKKGSKRTPDDISAQAARIFSYINSHPGQRAEQIARALATETKTLPTPIRKLLTEKKIKANGVARGTTYTAL
jgi:hypothetical protein